MKIIVHMGFPKTGTSSLQAYLQKYHSALAPFAKIYMKKNLGQLASAGRFYAQYPLYIQRLKFRKAVRNFLSSIPNDEVIIISRETLSGIMPGNHRFGFITAKKMSPHSTVLAKEVVNGLRRRFGEDAEIILLYTIRNKTSWHRSVWGHTVRSSNVKLCREDFVQELSNKPSLEEEVEHIRKNVKGAEIITRSLEELANHPLGPAGAITDLLELPADFAEKHPVKTVNNTSGPDELLQEYLQLNRTIHNSDTLRITKERLADDWRESQGFKRKHTKKN